MRQNSSILKISNLNSSISIDHSLSVEPADRGDIEPLWGNTAAAIRGAAVSCESTAIRQVSPTTVQVPSPASSIDRVTQPPIWSSAIQDTLDQPPSTLPMRVVAGGMLFCCAFLTWAWFGQVEEVGHARGRLVPQGEVYKVQVAEPGEVAKITVEEGQQVKAGQLIAELDDRLARAEVDRLEDNLAAYQIELFQIQMQIDRNRLETQTRRAISAAETRAQKAAIVQAQTSITTHREILAQTQTEAEAHQARLERLRPLVLEGAIAEDRLFEIEQALRDRQRVIIQSQGSIQQSIAEADQLQAELIQKQAEGEQSTLEAQQQLYELEMAATQLQAKITETKNLLRAAQTRLEQMFVQVPVDGTVYSVKIRNIGEVAQPGQTIAEIAPNHAPLVLSALLTNREAGFVKVGMPVQVKFDAFPYQDYGIVPGRVITVSPDAEKHEQLGEVYRVEIALDRSSIATPRQMIEFKAGQTATAEIIIRQRRVLDILLDPIKQLQKSGLSL
jgi:HlyD family type I secretion membrane fusion protein